MLSWTDIIEFLTSEGLSKWRIKEVKRLIKCMDIHYFVYHNEEKQHG